MTMNKFATPDKAKWITKLSVRPNSNGAEHRVHFFYFDPELDATGTIAKARDAYLKAFEVVDGLRARRGELEATKQYTPLGLQEQLGDAALKDALPALKRSRVVLDKLQAEMAGRRSKITLAKPDPADTIGEMQRGEMRKRLAEMSDEARRKFVLEHRDDPAVVQAIVHAPAVLSGTHDVQYKNIVAEQLHREHGETLEELDALDEVLKTAADTADKARTEMRSIIGCAPEVFDQIAKIAEANGGRAPMRRELRVVGGQGIEIPRVYDIDRKVWRDARADEIQGFAA